MPNDGIDFAGDGSTSINKSSTNAPSISTGGNDTVDFAGEGDKDANMAGSSTDQHQPGKQSVPQAGSDIKFAGDN